MKTIKQKILILIITQAFTLPVFCTWQASSELKKSETGFAADTLRNDTTIVYTCPMHPEILSDKPGNCPECGMQLVKKTSSVNNKHDEQHKMNMMCMPMNTMDMNHPKDKIYTNRIIIAMGTVMGAMMIAMLVLF